MQTADLKIASTRTARVLVVDDAESTRYVVSTWLRRAGHEVTEAASGDEALAAIATGRFDIAVLDVNLPDMSGFALCEAIKSRLGDDSIPVLHLSATAVGPEDRSRGLLRGADAYLVEPIESEELLATIEALLRGASAQRTARRLARQLRRLNEATLAISSATGLAELIQTIENHGTTLFESAVTVQLRVDGESFGAVGSEPEGPYLRQSLDDGPEQAGTIMVGVPDAAEKPYFREEAAVLLSQYARAAATAIKNIRAFLNERTIALTLQRNLLPNNIPQFEDLAVAVRYEASAQNVEVGGDFYEIFPLDDDRVLLAIGDVCGHSLEAATVMAQLRTAIRSYALEEHRPGAILAKLDRLLSKFYPDFTATACCGIYHRRSGRCELANAGHLPLVLATNGGRSALAAGGTGTLLGVRAASPALSEFALEPGDSALFYTDGLVERRGELLDASMARLVDAMRDVGRKALKDACSELIDKVAPRPVIDDIAMMMIRRLR